jgi:hypothetical protein
MGAWKYQKYQITRSLRSHTREISCSTFSIIIYLKNSWFLIG